MTGGGRSRKHFGLPQRARSSACRSSLSPPRRVGRPSPSRTRATQAPRPRDERRAMTTSLSGARLSCRSHERRDASQASLPCRRPCRRADRGRRRAGSSSRLSPVSRDHDRVVAILGASVRRICRLRALSLLVYQVRIMNGAVHPPADVLKHPTILHHLIGESLHISPPPDTIIPYRFGFVKWGRDELHADSATHH